MAEIRQTPMGGDLHDFLNVVDDVYRDDPHFVRPLDFDLKGRLHPRKNPFFQHAEGAIFTAYRSGRCVGRVTAQVDREHLARYKDDTGFFGFLDTIDDEQVAGELLRSAEAWLRSKGMKRIRGPLSLSTNEETGCLVEGFDSPPFIMMPHHRPYQGGLIEKAGYLKAKDFFAWKYVVGELNARTRRAHEEISKLPEVRARMVSLKDIERDVALVVDIFNDAWSENWGFVPLTPAELRKTAEDFKLILTPEITRLVYIDGEPAAMTIAVPNINEMIKDLHGKLWPLGAVKLIYRLKIVGAKTGRLAYLGIRRKFRHVRKYAAMSSYLFAEMNESGRKLGMKWGELGWTLEDNGLINAGIRSMGAHAYKRYRVYEKPLSA